MYASFTNDEYTNQSFTMAAGADLALNSSHRPDQGSYTNRSAKNHPSMPADPTTSTAAFGDPGPVGSADNGGEDDCWTDIGKVQYNAETKLCRHKCYRETCAHVTIKVTADVKRHYTSKHGGSKFECPVIGCTQFATRKDQIRDHVRNMHSSETQNGVGTGRPEHISRARGERPRQGDDAEYELYTC